MPATKGALHNLRAILILKSRGWYLPLCDAEAAEIGKRSSSWQGDSYISAGAMKGNSIREF